jgi:hypothetical protein
VTGPGPQPGGRAAPEVLDRITRIAGGLVCGPDEVVIACGSLVEGLGNAASDIDLLVVEPGTTETARAKDRPGVPLTAETIAEMLSGGETAQVDAEWVSRGYVLALIDRVHALAPGSRTVAEFIDLEQYYRFAAGAAVVNPEAYAPVRERMSVDLLGALLAADAAERAAGLLAETEAFRAAELLDAAAYAAQQLLSWTLHVHVIEQGERFPPRKWRYEKLARLCGPDSPVHRRAWRLKAPGGATPAGYVAEVLDLVHELRPAGGPDPGRAARAREALMAELRYAKDLEDVTGALDAGQQGMAFHALGRVGERLQDGCLLRHELGGGDPQRRLQLLRELAAGGDGLAARVLDIRLANPADLAGLRELAGRCRAAAAELGFRLAVPADPAAVRAFFADADAVFADRAHFRRVNYRASAGIGLETGLR